MWDSMQLPILGSNNYMNAYIATVLPNNVYGTVSATVIMVAGIGKIREDTYVLTGCLTLQCHNWPMSTFQKMSKLYFVKICWKENSTM